MNKEFIQEWIADLKSDNFDQTSYMLRRIKASEFPVGYCCIGVAGERLCQMGLMHQEDEGNISVFIWNADNKPGLEALPPEARDYIGLPQNVWNHLMTMNDDHFRSFDFIARWLEKYVALVDLDSTAGT